MELQRIICTTCGNSLEAGLDQSAITCDACGNTFLTTNGIDLASKSADEIGSIKKLRNNLQRAVIADDHKNILHFSKEILRLIPKDDQANYYYAYSNYTFGSRRYLFEFYGNQVTIPEEANKIIDHIIEFSDVRDKSLVETFIARNNPDMIDKYRIHYQKKLDDEENYSSIPRDIFISFRSTDIEIAMEVLEVLEADGNSCWISSRNLRPNDNENYWTNIEDAITKSKVFLVISSHDAMISRDVKKELDIATKQNKKRIELKIDTTRHTSLFKYFFDGCKWIDATKDKQEALLELKRRVYDLINDYSTKIKVSKKGNISENDEFVRKMNRAKVDLLSANFKDASNTIKDALGIDPENAEAWWMLFLSENGFSSIEQFNVHIKKKSITLSKLADLYNKVSYKQFKKHSMATSNRHPARIEDFEAVVYDYIIKNINKTNLSARNKREYLQSHFPKHILTVWTAKLFEMDIKTDDQVKQRLEDDYRIKELENLFDDFEELENHPHYSSSHIKSYKETFLKNYEITLKKRQKNLSILKNGIDGIYSKVETYLNKGKYKLALNKSLELFYFDNSSLDKYLYVFLSKIKAKNTEEAYDQFAKQKPKVKDQLLKSIVFKKLFKSDKYHAFMNDLILHANYKKKKKKDRIYIMLRGEENDLQSVQ